jgi:acid phosphatase family membrane protein YuiD
MVLSLYIITTGLAWGVAQLIKYILGLISGGQWYDTTKILNSGNMPSVHTATTVALTTIIGLKDGTGSALFALSLLLTAIIAYDAMGVRRSSGEQGLALRSLLAPKVKKPYIALGHKPLEVGVGAIVGISVSLFVAFFTPFF